MATKRKKSSRTTKPRGAASPAVIAPCLWFDGQAEEAARF